MRDTSHKALDALLASASDGTDAVKDQVVSSLRLLASKGLVDVLKHIEQWLSARKPSSTPAAQRYIVCRAIVEILATHAQPGTVPNAVLDALLACAFNEMTSLTDYTSEWALEASRLYNDLTDLAPQLGIPRLLTSIQSGTVPHFFVVKGLADYAERAPLRFIPYLSEALAKLLPMLTAVRQDNQRMIFALALGAFSEAALMLPDAGAILASHGKFSSASCDDITTGDVTVADQSGDGGAEDGEEGADPSDKNAAPLTPRSEQSSHCSIAQYSDAFYTGLQVLLQDWTRISEQRVRGPVALAVGAMSACVSNENRAGVAAKVVQHVVGALKKDRPKDQGAVARGAACIAQRCTAELRPAFEPLWEPLFQALLQSTAGIAADRDYHTGNRAARKVMGSMLRWSEAVCEANCDGFCTFLSRTLDAKTGAKDAAVRAAAVLLLRNVILRKALVPRLKPFANNLVATLKLAIGDMDWRVRSAVAGAVVAMGQSPIGFFNLVGGPELLFVLLRGASISDRIVDDFAAAAAKKDPGLGTTPDEVRNVCRMALKAFTATETPLDGVLWPRLLEHVALYPTEPELLHAFETLCTAVVPLAERRGMTDEFYVDFRMNVNMPRPGAFTIALFVQLLQFHRGPHFLNGVMQAMTAVAPLLDEPFLFTGADGAEPPAPIADLWLATIPELEGFLADAPTDVEWEDVVCRLVSKTVTARQDAEWVEQMAGGAAGFMPAYASDTLLFRANAVVLGIALGKCPKRDFVQATLQQLIDGSDHDSADHRSGVVKAASFVVANKEYVDMTLEKLAAIAKAPEKKGFFSFGGDKKTGPRRTDKSRAITAAGLCAAAKKMPQAVLASRIDAVTLPQLTTILNESNDPDVRTAVYEGILLLEAPLKKLGGQYNFKARDQFVEQLVGLATAHLVAAGDPKKGGPGALPHAVAALDAITAVINASQEPLLAPATRDKLYNFAVQHYLPCRAFPAPGDAPATKDKHDKEKRPEELVATAVVNMMTAIQEQQPAIELNQCLEPIYGVTANEHDAGARHRAVLLLSSMVKSAAVRLDAALQIEDGALPTLQLSTGAAVARLVPRFMDVIPEIRRTACETIALLFKLHALTHPDLFDGDSQGADAAAKEVKTLRTRAAAVDLNDKNTDLVEKEVASVTKPLCSAIAQVLPTPEYFSPVLDVLLRFGLREGQVHAAGCCCVVMHGIVRGMGGSLAENQVKEYLASIVDTAAMLEGRDQTRNGLLVSARNLAKHHPRLCFEGLMQYDAPHPSNVVHTIQSVASDTSLSKQFIPYCIDVVLNSQMLTDQSTKDKPVLARTPMSAALALGWIAQTARGADLLLEPEARHQSFCAVLVYLSSCHALPGCHAKAELVAASMKHLLQGTLCDVSLDRMARYGWNGFDSSAQFLHTAAEVMKYIVQEELLGEENVDKGDRGLGLDEDTISADAKPGLALAATEPTQFVVDVAEFLLPYVNKTSRAQRRVAVYMCGALLRHARGDDGILQSVVAALLGRTGSDEDSQLRAVALASFRKILLHDYPTITAFVAPILAALLQNYDDKDEDLVTESMKTLRVLFTGIEDKTQIKPIVVNILLRVKPKLTHSNDAHRALAYGTLGDIAAAALEGTLDATTVEPQMHLHLVTVILFMEDNNDNVKGRAREALASMLRFIAARFNGTAAERESVVAEVEDMVTKPHIADADAPSNFDEFADDFATLWVRVFMSKINDIFTAVVQNFENDRDPLRVAAPVLVGCLLKRLGPEELPRTNADTACTALMRLASGDKLPAVRRRAVRALGMLPAL